jgi:ribosomal-protein-alanine N-acetyltransferase
MIRKLKKDEYELIVPLVRELRPNFTTKDIGELEEIYIYEDVNIIGFIEVLSLYETLEIINIVVDSQKRREGIGSKLIIDLVEKYKPEKILLEVRSKNTSAIKFYEHLGFKPIRQIKNYYINDDAVVMERTEL